MSAQTLDRDKMEARVARFKKLQSYQTQNLATQGIPPALALRHQHR